MCCGVACLHALYCGDHQDSHGRDVMLEQGGIGMVRRVTTCYPNDVGLAYEADACHGRVLMQAC